MNFTKGLIKKQLVLFIAFVQVLGFFSFAFSSLALADSTCPTSTGINKPTGSASVAFTFNPDTCLWENAYYSWSSVTKTYTPKFDKTPVLNTAGTAWEYTDWVFIPTTGTYRAVVRSIPVPQTSPGSIPGTTQTTSPAISGTSGQGSNLNGGSTISNTGPDSNNTINNSNNINGNINNTNNSQILTTLDSKAISGNAYVTQNTNGGSASTGDAQAIANFLNMIQSSWSPTSGNVNVFDAGLYGNFYGDILLNPNAILNTGPSSNNSVNNNNNGNLTINSQDNSDIVNNINLAANSGDAKVAMNTNGGDASSGDAMTLANVINMINSSILSGQSFLGSLNIYGDLNGDLLLPSGVLNELKKTGPYSSNSINNNNQTDVNLNVANNNSITNNLDLAANSGLASVNNNTNAGSATSGDATTSARQLNVVGQNSAGTKGLVVFVNVLGTWVGTLWDGTSTQSIFGSGPSSNNIINNNNNTNIDANLVQNNNITNNFNLNATSGNAIVSQNTNAGNATSGDASSSVNLLNVIDSNLNFSDWFGVLFINVFGDWQGSFGIDTNAGNTPPVSYQPLGGRGGGSSSGESSSGSGGSGGTSSANGSVSATTGYFQNLGNSISTTADNSVKSEATINSNNGTNSDGETSSTNKTKDQNNLASWILLAAIIGFLGFVFRDRILSIFKQAK